jgi:hypothetical protein
MGASKENIPLLKQSKDNIWLQQSYVELAFRGEYSGTNLIYVGKARPGSAEGELVWQISFLTYDGSGNLLSVEWPINSADNRPSSEFLFSWTDRASYTYV